MKQNNNDKLLEVDIYPNDSYAIWSRTFLSKQIISEKCFTSLISMFLRQRNMPQTLSWMLDGEESLR